jgi:hypothetical protein
LQVDFRDSDKSKSIRDLGVKLFQSRNFEKALDKFTEAMLLAPIKIGEKKGLTGKCEIKTYCYNSLEMGEKDNFIFVSVAGILYR